MSNTGFNERQRALTPYSLFLCCIWILGNESRPIPLCPQFRTVEQIGEQTTSTNHTIYRSSGKDLLTSQERGRRSHPPPPTHTHTKRSLNTETTYVVPYLWPESGNSCSGTPSTRWKLWDLLLGSWVWDRWGILFPNPSSMPNLSDNLTDPDCLLGYNIPVSYWKTHSGHLN